MAQLEDVQKGLVLKSVLEPDGGQHRGAYPYLPYLSYLPNPTLQVP